MKPSRNSGSQFWFRSKKSLGQNFLVKEEILKKIVELAQIAPEDYVLEIGPGPGNLTKYLVKKAKKVLAIELDPDLVNLLKTRVKAKNLGIIQADILKFNVNEIIQLGRKFKVVSNLPYNISSQVIFKLLETRGVFSELYLMLQKEVAERVVAKPKTRAYGILSVIVQIHSEPEIILRVGPDAFRPKPKVDSALVRFKILAQPRFEVSDYEGFKQVVKACFGQRRKTILNSLTGSKLNLDRDQVKSLLSKAGVSARARAEELGLESLVKLANLYQKEKDARTS